MCSYEIDVTRCVVCPLRRGVCWVWLGLVVRKVGSVGV